MIQSSQLRYKVFYDEKLEMQQALSQDSVAPTDRAQEDKPAPEYESQSANTRPVHSRVG